MFVVFDQASVLIRLVSLTSSDRNVPSLSAKRHRDPLDPASTPLLKKIRPSSGSSPRRTLSNASLHFAALLPLTAVGQWRSVSSAG